MADKNGHRPESSDAGAAGERPWRSAVGAELFWIEETCSYAAQCQEETARVWRTTGLLTGACAVLTGGVAGSLMLAGGRFGVLAGALALLSALFSTLIGMVGPARRESRGTESAKEFQAVQALARQARAVDLATQHFDQARATLGGLTDRWQAANQAAVPVSRWARIRSGRHTGPDAVDEVLTNRMSDLVNVFVPAPRAAGG